MPFLVLGFLLSFGTIQAQFWTQIGQDINGEAENDFSGIALSLSSSGSVIAIAAHANDGSGIDADHVFMKTKVVHGLN